MDRSCKYPDFAAGRRAMAASESVHLADDFAFSECPARVGLLPNVSGTRAAKKPTEFGCECQVRSCTGEQLTTPGQPKDNRAYAGTKQNVTGAIAEVDRKRR